MKIIANAGELANALALAASLGADKLGKKIPALGAVHLVAADDEIAISANILDFALTLTVPAAVETAGELAVSAVRLAGLAAAFDAEDLLEISDEGPIANVGCGRSRFKLPMLPAEDLPPAPKLIEETGNVTLAREEAVKLLVKPTFAASTEKTRYYLCGVLLRDDGNALSAVAIDGQRIFSTRIPGATGLSSDFHLIVPSAALKVIGKLLSDRNVERVALRRSKALLAVEATTFTFVSKLIDATFPDYTRLVPKPSGNSITVDRIELLGALARIAAVAEDQKRHRVTGLTWSEGEPELRLCLVDSDAADDVIAAQVSGKGRTAVQIHLLGELVDALNGKAVNIDSSGAGQPILILDPDDEDVLSLVMPFAWAAQASQAA